MSWRMLVGVAAAAAVVAGLAGCSSSKPNAGTATSSVAGGSVATAVIVDGQNQNIAGPVTCTAAGDNTNIGIGDPSNGVGAVVTNAAPPDVHAVGLGSVNGITFGYADAAEGQGSATATLNGKSYKITGTATGFDTGSQQSVTKSFELDATCP